LSLEQHTVREIMCRVSDELRGLRIALAVSASSAIYRALDLARQLIRRCASVRVVMTRSAAELVNPKLFEWATGSPVFIDVSGQVEHIALAREVHAVVIAPATLRRIALLAYGIGEDLVTLLSIAAKTMGKLVVLVPAMHIDLWNSVQCREAVRRLDEAGYVILPPYIVEGRLVFPDPKVLARVLTALILRGRDLKGLRLVVSAGATREFIDDVRFISNPSSGRMGVEIALEAWARGAHVVLVAGHLEVVPPPWIPTVRCTSTEDMLNAMVRAVEQVKPHAVIMAAAPADFKPSSKFRGKIDSRVERLNLTLVPTPKIVQAIRRVFDGVLVGFAAEAVESVDEGRERALEKLREHGLDMVVLNPVLKPGIGFGSEFNEVLILDRNGDVLHIPRTRKEVVARILLDKVRQLVRS